jgi:hypothetical protein
LVWAWNREGLLRRSAVAVAAVIAALGVVVQRNELRRPSGAPRHAASLRLAVLSIVRETDPDAVLASDDHALLYLLSARRAIPIDPRRSGEDAGDTGRIVTRYCDARVTHVLSLDSSAAAATGGVLTRIEQEHPGSIRPLMAMTDGPALFAFRCPA